MSDDSARVSVRSVRVHEVHLRADRRSATVDSAAVERLAGSIREIGLLEPLLVRPRPEGGYELISGERRWRAARVLKLEAVPAVVREIDDATANRLIVDRHGQTDPVPVTAMTAGLSADIEYGMPPPARSAAPRREPRVISGPGLPPVTGDGSGAPAGSTPEMPATPLTVLPVESPDDERRRRPGFGFIPRLRPLARRDRA
jgi:hypothetical protein